MTLVSFYWKLLEAMSVPQVIANFNAHIHYQERQLKELDKAIGQCLSSPVVPRQRARDSDGGERCGMRPIWGAGKDEAWTVYALLGTSHVIKAVAPTQTPAPKSKSDAACGSCYAERGDHGCSSCRQAASRPERPPETVAPTNIGFGTNPVGAGLPAMQATRSA
ncbi:hypothetical protein D3C85_1003240 [compost metagenome]